jgi:hypothetical protein
VTGSLFPDADMPYGVHILPDGNHGFIVILGRDDDGDCSAKAAVSPADLAGIAETLDGLFARAHRMERVIAARNFLAVYGTYTDHDIARLIYSGEYDTLTAEEFRLKFPRRGPTAFSPRDV